MEQTEQIEKMFDNTDGAIADALPWGYVSVHGAILWDVPSFFSGVV